MRLLCVGEGFVGGATKGSWVRGSCARGSGLLGMSRTGSKGSCAALGCRRGGIVPCMPCRRIDALQAPHKRVDPLSSQQSVGASAVQLVVGACMRACWMLHGRTSPHDYSPCNEADAGCAPQGRQLTCLVLARDLAHTCGTCRSSGISVLPVWPGWVGLWIVTCTGHAVRHTHTVTAAGWMQHRQRSVACFNGHFKPPPHVHAGAACHIIQWLHSCDLAPSPTSDSFLIAVRGCTCAMALASLPV